MKKNVWGLALGLALVRPAWGAEGAAKSLATAFELRPQVEIHRGMNHQALKQGAALYEEDRIRTSPTGSTGLKFKEGTLLRLLQEGDLTFRTEAQSGTACLLQLAKGTLQASVRKQEQAAFRIFTGQGVVAVRAARLQMVANGFGTEIRVLEGSAEFTGMHGDSPLKIGAGQKAVSEAGSKAKKMPAPELASLRKAFKHNVFKKERP